MKLQLVCVVVYNTRKLFLISLIWLNLCKYCEHDASGDFGVANCGWQVCRLCRSCEKNPKIAEIWEREARKNAILKEQRPGGRQVGQRLAACSKIGPEACR